MSLKIGDLAPNFATNILEDIIQFSMHLESNWSDLFSDKVILNQVWMKVLGEPVKEKDPKGIKEIKNYLRLHPNLTTSFFHK